MSDDNKIFTYVCSKEHSMVTYKYHDGIVPQIIKCRTCGKDAFGVSKKAVHNTKFIGIWRQPTKFEYDCAANNTQRYYHNGGLKLDHFNGHSGLFKELKVSEIPEFRDWALSNFKAGNKIEYGLHHPVVVYECERINDSANGWSLPNK